MYAHVTKLGGVILIALLLTLSFVSAISLARSNPGGEGVIPTLRVVTADVWIDQQVHTPQVGVGGRVRNKTTYGNRGDVIAHPVTTTDSLPVNVNYAWDRGLFAATVFGGEKMWNLGDLRLSASSDHQAKVGLTVTTPQFEITKSVQSSDKAGTPVTYTLRVNNTGNEADNDVIVMDPLPTYLTYQSGGFYDEAQGAVIWTLPALAAGDFADLTFVGQLTCASPVTVTNSGYRVSGSRLGITSNAGPDVAVGVTAPTVQVDFTQSAVTTSVGAEVIFTSTAVTDGAALFQFSWDFGDGESDIGRSVAHTYALPGVYTVTHTVADPCGYGLDTPHSAAVTVKQQTFLPLVIQQGVPSFNESAPLHDTDTSKDRREPVTIFPAPNNTDLWSLLFGLSDFCVFQNSSFKEINLGVK